MMCLNAEGYPHGQSNYLDFLWMSYNDMTNCDQHHDLDSCNTDSDCVYLLSYLRVYFLPHKTPPRVANLGGSWRSRAHHGSRC